MADSRVIQVTLKAVADMSDVSSNIEQIKRGLSGLALPKSLESQFARVFQSLEGNITKATDQMASGFTTKGAASAFEKTTNLITSDMTKLVGLMNKIDPNKLNFEVGGNQLKTLADEIAQIQAKIDAINTANLEKLKQIEQNPPSSASAWGEFFSAIKRGESGVGDAEKALKRLEAQVEKAKGQAGGVEKLNDKWKTYKIAVDACREALDSLKDGNTEINTLQQEQNDKLAQAAQLREEVNTKGREGVSEIISGTQKMATETGSLNKNLQDTATSQASVNSELDMFKSRISYFFGMTNAVMLFRRALRSTFETVKDLDKVMTETAVVTEFDVGDMWSQLPEYTERANQLGISIHDAYEAATLYYQQGLSTNEVMAVSNETLKMARIAGLDAAEATDRMTNALRGFNMEITESNAQNINDVYSNLAAKTASNVDEISTAMTKVASLAHNANMSFENTAAFLSQIIETTRESAETAGTALKTVIARFSEVKELYSTGELLGTDEEGEEIDVNKVSKALRTAGINLNEYLTGMKGLDEIFIELSEKWNSLDQVQQRYIATMAAGSRQQSRFIALMQDNVRMTEMLGYANDAAGASQGQFEKTLESLESKLNNLKNTWNTFLMGIANSDAIKFAVDALTNLFNVLNDITGKLPGMAKSIANIAIIFSALSIGKSIFNGVFSSVGTLIRGESEKIGQESGAAGGVRWSQGFGKGMLGNLTAISLALTAVGGILMKFADRLEKTSKTSKGFIDSLRKAGRFLTTFGSIAITASLVMNAFGKTVTIVGGQIAIAGKVAESGWLWLAAIVGAGLALYSIIKLITNSINKNSPEKKLERAKKATEEAKQAAQEAQERYDSLNSSIDSLKEQYSTLDSLTKGTEEWRDAVKETNDKVLELMGNYAELGKYVNLENGVLKINFEDEDVQNYLNETYKNSIKSSVASLLAEKTQDSANIEVKREKVEKSAYGRTMEITENESSSPSVREIDRLNRRGWEQNTEVRDLVAKALANNSAAIEEIAKKYGVGVDLLAEDREKYVEAIIDKLDFLGEFEHRDSKGNVDYANYIQGFVDENALTALTEYGNALLESAKEQEYYNSQILTSAAILSDLTDEEKQYAYNYLNSDEIEEIRKQAEEEIKNQMNDSTQLSNLYEEYAEKEGYKNYDDYLAQHNYEDVSDEILIGRLAADRVVDITIERINDFGNALENMPPILKRVYEASEGQALTLSDTEKSLEEVYAEIKGIKVEDIDPQAFIGWKNSKEGQDYAQAQEFATQRFAEPKNILDQSGIQLNEEDYLKNIPSDILQNFTNQLISVITSSGPDAAKAIASNLENVLKMVPKDLQDVFLEQLNVMDWNNLEEVEGFTDVLEELNIEINESDPAWQQFIQSIKEGADSIKKFDLKSIADQADNLAKIQKGIRENKDTRSFSEDDYNTMMSTLGSEWADKFYKDEEGNYSFIGGSMEDLATALKENTNAVLQGAKDQLNAKIGTSDILSDMEKRGITADKYSNEQMFGYLKTAAIGRGIDLKDLGIEGLSNDTRAENLKPEKLNSILEQILAILKEDLEGQRQDLNKQEAQINARNNTAQENASMVNTEYGDEYIKALEAQAYAAGIDAKEIEGLTIALESENAVEKVAAAQRLANLVDIQKEIELYGLDAQAVSDYAKQLMAADSSLDLSTAKSQAVTLTRLNRGLESLADSYDKWIELVDDSGRIVRKFGTKSESTFKDLKDAIKDIADVGDELPDTFLEDANNVELLKQAIEGDTEALKQLQVAAREAAAENYVIDAGLNTDEFNNQFNEFANWCAEVKLPDLEAGAYLNDQSYLDGLYNILQASGATADQIKAFFDSLGFDIEYERVPITASAPTYGPAPRAPGDTRAPQIVVTGTATIPSTMTIPKPKFRYKGTTPGSISAPTPRSTGSCFVAGTLITTFSGFKSIELIQAGDIVLSYNERTHQNEYSAVLQTMIHDVTENIYTLYIENDILEVTGIHRFYIMRNNKKHWIPVQDFQENDFVQFADGTLHRIEKVEIEVRTTRVYNFEVSNNHNYYVGEDQVLAHNKGGGCFAAGTLVTLQGFYKNIEQVSVGDVVLSYNEQKKKNEYSTVVQTMIHLVKEKIYTLYVERDKLVVTGIHRFYITRGKEASWIPAEELCVGDKVRFADGTLHDIAKISVEEKSLIVYNFEVSNTHNYYVGRSQILAHNKGGSGSSGSGGKDNKWENPFDELFNLQEKINASIRERESLERKYQKLIKGTKTTVAEIRQNYTDQIMSLRKQIGLQKQLKTGRLKQIKDLSKQDFSYENSKGKTVTKSFKKMGVTKYASFDPDTGAVTIDWKGLNKLTKSSKTANKGAAAEEYINQLRELADSVNDINSTVGDLGQQIDDQNREALELYTSYEDRMRDALVTVREKQIDALESLSEAVDQASRKVIDRIQEQISLERQSRENEKTEEDLQKKQNRLAYLQRDTSNANATEILSLQKEIADAQESYEDHLIDQALERMTKDADVAAEQRASQIEIMRSQLQIAQETGAIWTEVYDLINGMTKSNGRIDLKSEGAEVLKEAEGYAGLSTVGKELWQQDTKADFYGAQQGMAAGHMENAGDEIRNEKEITTALKKHIAATYLRNIGGKQGGWNKKKMTQVFGETATGEIYSLINTYKKNPKKYKKTWAADKYTYKNQKGILYKKYASGGLADFTGPAWLDGTKSKPEIVLNSTDSKNLIILKDVLSSLLNGKNNIDNKNNGGANYFDIDITAELKNDYDVDQLAARIKKQIQQDGQYRNVNTINFLR